ncbi:PRKR-interacting protein 1 [Aspergillus udagawae]|uniref:PRKR-interacting protein 1 n=1 Tax=Aspergillus udagawae TaxID=91492 RepID=A0A8H3NZ01_9EURO|nr:PRKR-interacting protein 1 [Aspergillus udagawae]GFF41429.1 PRKR-interacting protein 1 [Aspergillus udagawae]GFF90774.1 PRKR-interacting protein 1 [Aspergillus udagawae]GFG18719.1 PRKR-interacting protein 1 [Aspergillus udagawae]GFG27766.1 PRKR-interacting protein 1 [Aspergillus udagawae]
MSEPGPESIPTSADPRSKRPVKRRAVTPLSEQASQIEHLFRDPNKEIKIPEPSKQRSAASLAPPPEIVANVQGSSAGAGSGEFHVYKASRRREYERLRLMQSEVEKEQEDKAWEQKREEARRKDEEKTEKNRRRREKRNATKKKSNDNNNNNKDQNAAVSNKGPNKMAVEQALRRTEHGQGDEEDQAMAVEWADHSTETPGVIIHED